jgi:predicted 3-demethylubiquinone-9 3-methyltransferase (glyoxalase superfamily)
MLLLPAAVFDRCGLTVQLPPHVLFDLLADPHQHERIFDEIVVSSSCKINRYE